ncbi:MAG: hypothetical protein IJJ76_11510 [Ruminococcus sp.]|uniref:hypothetical protein n=1 Tax=Ruminococcus sp. TaxID=41978 RepID=UPI0025DC108B|nr:hypothetical protein [Ruminococcus sp.]MBR0530373.1 hypothetical protein [Ruminococcus sp.]
MISFLARDFGAWKDNGYSAACGKIGHADSYLGISGTGYPQYAAVNAYRRLTVGR